MRKLIRPDLVAAACIAALPLAPTLARTAAQQPSSTDSVELRPGVVVDLQRRMAYVMNPKGGIDALSLDRGRTVWHSDQGARPLTATRELLVTQAELPRAGNQLQVKVLEARTGRQRRAASHMLPSGVKTTVVGTAEGTFTIQAGATATDATLVWEFVEIPQQGVRPGALEVDRPAAERAAGEAQPAKPPTATGVVRISLTTGRATESSAGDAPSIVRRAADQPAQSRIPSITGQQFASVDGRHVLTSERVADDSVWEKYQWTIFEAASGRRLGAVRDYRSHAPFIVTGGSIIYEIGPFERETDKGRTREPLQIRAVNLAKGTQLWTRVVRDTTYRGPFPG